MSGSCGSFSMSFSICSIAYFTSLTSLGAPSMRIELVTSSTMIRTFGRVDSVLESSASPSSDLDARSSSITLLRASSGSAAGSSSLGAVCPKALVCNASRPAKIDDGNTHRLSSLSGLRTLSREPCLSLLKPSTSMSMSPSCSSRSAVTTLTGLPLMEATECLISPSLPGMSTKSAISFLIRGRSSSMFRLLMTSICDNGM